MDVITAGSVRSPQTRVRRQRKHPPTAADTPPSMVETPQRLVEAGSGGAPGLADAKRLKHREYVKRSYNKKISTIEALKTELEALEAQYTAMLATTTRGAEADPKEEEKQEQELAGAAPPLLLRYKQLTAAKNRLREENDALYALNARRMKTEGRVHQLLRTETPLPRVATPFRFRALPAAEYAQLLVEARNEVLRFAHAPDKLSSGARVFGWTDQRQVAGDELKFALEKRFAGVSASELLQRSWRIFSSPERFPQVYSATLRVRFHVLQRVNEDTVLFYRTIEPADSSGLCVKVLFVLARLKLDDGGFLLLFRSVDRARLRFREDEIHAVVAETHALGHRPRDEHWADKFIWVLFRDHHDGGCAFHFGGATTTALWLQEVLFIALRWESLAVGPQFALTVE
ncbi:hypothetical protein PybrP1_007507 [[Pythium] brassicae (nom. inval.)]|nr:hypothetical protein PybrP1_007507 [[Pythium] brassicae (nom. inval.)]